jgi:hypothetical protein
MTQPRQVSAEAERFLRALDRNDKLHFRAVPERPDLKSKPRRTELINGTFEDLKHRLRSFNEAGYAIYVQPNFSDGKGHKSANIIGCNCVFADFDGVPIDTVKRLGLEPHVMVTTSENKAHFYWRIAELTVDDFRKIQPRLIALFGSDPVVKDAARVMRLPGFLHQKDGDAPHLVTCQTQDAPPYTKGNFVEALCAAEKLYPPAAQAKPSAKRATAETTTDVGRAKEIKRAKSALDFIIGQGVLSPGDYGDWLTTMFALKHSLGEDGFALFHDISKAAPGYDGEAKCRAKWDSAGDRPEGEAVTIGSIFKRAQDAGWEDPTRKPKGGDGSAPTGAALVVIQSELEDDEFFLDSDATPHVRFKRVVAGNERWVISRINDNAFGDYLGTRYLRDAGKALASDQRASAQAMFTELAIERGEVRPVFQRVGCQDGAIYIDVGDAVGNVIQVTTTGWAIVDDAPVYFRRGNRGALPLPERGGTLDDFAAEFPNFDASDVTRILGFILGTFNLKGTCPLLQLSGGQGLGKSTTADKILALTDPPIRNGDGRTSFSRKEHDLIIHASNVAVVLFDNVSQFTDQQADWLCRLASGSAMSTRRLYTGNQEDVIALRRPVIVNGIGSPTTRGDLLDRTVIVTARPFSSRLTEEEVRAQFEHRQPEIFGFILDCLVAALANADAVAALKKAGTIKLPRLADFASFVEGAAQLIGIEPGEFSRLIMDEQLGQQAEAAAGDPLGAALIALIRDAPGREFVGTASELREALAPRVESHFDRMPYANKIRSYFERLTPGLQDLGLTIAFAKATGHKNVQTIKVTVDERFAFKRTKDHI